MLDLLATNYLRVTSALEINGANSGHTGVCLGASPIFFSIYKNAIVDAKNPNYINRDRIVFSAGHSSALVYACLNLFGFDVLVSDLKSFRKLNSRTPGHPEVKVTAGVDMSTGPLGQGVANAVGFAIAEEFLRNKFAKGSLSPINHYTYCFTGDGCLMEGVAQEAISLAGSLKLNKLILLYDKNDITIEGDLSITNREDTKAKFLSMNWNVLEVMNGNSVSDIDEAIKKAKQSDKPTIIIIKTKIGYGCELEGSNKIHGKPLNFEQILTLRKNLNYFAPDYEIPIELKNYIDQLNSQKQKTLLNQKNDLDEYRRKFPNEYKEFLELENYFNVDLSNLPFDNVNDFDARKEGHKILNKIGEIVPNLIGGSADLNPSTMTNFDNSNFFSYLNRTGRNLPFGIREHSMGAIANGISMHTGLRCFCSTFFTFANYMTPAIRMSALMENPVLYIFTHDSINIGEDGPTHQPVEQLATMRALPDILVFRPCGRQELLAGFQTFFNKNKPLCLLISRQVTPLLEDNFNNALMGGYIISNSKDAVATILSTGSEVNLVIKAQQILAQKNIFVKVASFPCFELFDSQSKSYKDKILDKSKPIFCVEASSDKSLYKYATSEETILQLNAFGKSGSSKDVLNYFGFTETNIANFVENYLNKNE